MSKSNTTENDILKAVLQGTDPSWRAGANLYLAFYTADPGEGGTAITSETAYTNYARQTLVKSSAWTDGGSSFTNADLIQFPQCGASGATLTHVAVVTTSSGAGQIIYSGALNSSLAVANLIQPQFAIGALTVTED
jgi:hypothetical protein